MSTIYDLTTNQQVLELAPPDKRYTNTIQFLRACLRSTVQYLRDALIGDYRLGFTGATWTAGTYARGAKAQYQRAVYVSLIDGNTDMPSTTDNWYKQQDNFIGVNERILYTGHTIVFEYAINKYFGTTFRQPGTGTSDIYLTNNSQPIKPFVSGISEVQSSVSYTSTSSEYSVNSPTFTGVANLVIHVPSAVYNNSLQRSFADKYIAAGITYQIASY